MKILLQKTVVYSAMMILLFTFYGCGYNTLVSQEETVSSSWAQVENQYQRRADLVPNLVNTVKGAADFERTVLTEVTDARSRVGQTQITAEDLDDPAKFQAFQQSQDQLSSALSRLLMVVENYPDIKSNENFLQLQAQLEGTENRIAVERRRFNEAVQQYNTTTRRFPTLITAKLFGFKDKLYFRSREGSDIAPDVEFDFNNKKDGN